jgi:hypothetical protein
VDDVTEVGSKDNLWDRVTEGSEFLVGWLESSLGAFWQVKNKSWLIDLDSVGTGCLQLLEKLNIDWDKLFDERDWLNGLVTVWLSEVEERDWADKDWASVDTSLLCLKELNNSFWVGDELEGLRILEGWLHVMVVCIEPFNHLQRWDIDTLLLETTTHGEVFIDRVEVIFSVSLWDSLDGNVSVFNMKVFVIATYTEILDVSKNLIVQSEVIAGDDIDTSLLLDFPVGKTETLGLGEELSLSDLSTPVVLCGLLEITVYTHAGETEDRSVRVFISIILVTCSTVRRLMSLPLAFSSRGRDESKDLRLNHVCGPEELR